MSMNSYDMSYWLGRMRSYIKYLAIPDMTDDGFKKQGEELCAEFQVAWDKAYNLGGKNEPVN